MSSGPSPRDPALHLLEIEAIKELKARYFRHMDAKEWDAFADVLSADAELDVTDDAGSAAGVVRGRESIVDGAPVGLRGYGHCFETCRRSDGVWRIATLKPLRPS